MKLIPSVLNWSFHRDYWGRWNQSLDSYVGRVSKMSQKYNFTEMGINLGIGGDQNQLAEYSKAYVKNTKRKLQNMELHPIPVLGTLDIHADSTFVEQSLEQLKGALERAEWLGANVSTFNINVHGRLTREKAVQIYTSCLKVMAQYASDYGQEICSENYNTLLSDEIITAIENTGFDNVGYLNDVGNWLITGEDPFSVTKKLASRTIHVHLKDYLLDDGVWRSVPLGKGIVPLNKILQSLSETKVDRTVYMALETDLDFGDEDAALEDCFQFMREWFNQNFQKFYKKENRKWE